MSLSFPRPGALVAFWDGNALRLGVVGGEEKQRVRLVVERGREERVTAGRLAYEVSPPAEIPGRDVTERRAAGERVAGATSRLEDAASAVDVATLWEIVGSEAGELESPELAELALEARDGEACTVLTLALLSDGLYFSRRAESFVPRDADTVAGLRRERETAERRRVETEALFSRLRASAAGGEFEPDGGEVERRYLEALEQLALEQDDAPESVRAVAVEALREARQRFERPHEGAFRLLRRLGRFDDDDVSLPALRYRLPGSFPNEVEQAAEQAVTRGFSRTGRHDLTGRTMITIDGPRTREIDDGLSARELPSGGWELWVHIADPVAFVRPDDPVDREARARVLTHYHPDRRITMLPPAISEQAASLAPEQERPALSFMCEIAPDGRLADWQIQRAVVRSAARVDYDEADRLLGGASGAWEELLRMLDRLAAARESARLEAGALLLQTPDVDPWVDEAGRPCLERRPADSPSRRIVTEAMVLAGEAAARFCSSGRIPAIYRRQESPADPPPPGTRIEDPVAIRRVRRTLRRGEASIVPGPHFALGLEAYLQVTSPLRRFADLAVQRQIGSCLGGGGAFYDESAMRRIVAAADAAEGEARRAERAAREYWVLRYLERQTGEVLEGRVVDTDPKPVVQLLETLWEQPMPGLAGSAAGEVVRLQVERVNPRAGVLVLRRVA